MKTKVLIIRMSSIGDIVLTSPVIRHLHQSNQDIELHYLVKNKFKSVVASDPRIDQIWSFDDNLSEVIPELSNIKFDYVIDLHNNMRSRQAKSKLSGTKTTLNKLNVKKWIWVNTGYNLMPDVHIVNRYLDCISDFNVAPDNKGLDFFIPKKENVSIPDIDPSLRANGYIAWVIGATYKGKRFSVEKNVELLNKVQHPVVLMGGPAEVEDAEQIMAQTANNVFNAVGQFNLYQSASIVKQARLVVTPDTGLMHIASAFKKDILSIWGCTRPGLGMYPYHPGENSQMFLPQNVRPQPCSKLGNRCKYKGGCINRIDEKLLLKTMNDLMTG